MLHVLIFVVSILLAIYWYLNRNYYYWAKLDVPFVPPVTFFGNLADSFLVKRSLGQIYADIYNSYNDLPYVGCYKMRQPILLIRDANIVKDVLVKNFQNFGENDFLPNLGDIISVNNPFFLTGERWKITRSQLSQCFTSGKIKLMFPLMTEVSKNMIKYLEDECKMGGNPIDAKELAAKFTTDNVASCAFGVEGKSFEDPDAEIRKMGKQIFAQSFLFTVKILCIFLFPAAAIILKLQVVPKKIVDYFKNIIQATLKFRTENNFIRNDFLDTVRQLKTITGESVYNTDVITAHALSFFLDGFETSSVALSYTLYEIAANSEVQKTLRQEVEEILSKNNGVLDYVAVQEMKYLDWVLSESLRIHPPALFLSKKCTKDYNLPPCKDNGKEITLKKGTTVIISPYGLHHNPKYFSNPEEFYPDRFADSSDIIKGSYIPFGDGPRTCLGMRFTVFQIKVALLSIVKDFNISINNKTIQPLQIDPTTPILAPKGGIWLDFHKRNDESY